MNTDIVDDLNAGHPWDAGAATPAHVTEHLRSSGDALIALITGLEPDKLDLDGGRVRRFAMIAARHADTHRAEIQAALAAPG